MAAAETVLLTDLLKQVSRSFYLTLRMLPRAVRPQISLAYLLARTTDTIADTEILPVGQRLDALGKLRARMTGQEDGGLDFAQLAHHQGSPAERVLLERVADSLALLRTLGADDLVLVRKVLGTIASGQELDLRRFADASSARIVALESDGELDDYTFRVAGCVGEFWTRMCWSHLFPDAKLDEAQFLGDAVRFGKGLQLVNILRDLPRDLRQGRCYIPAQRLARAGLQPGDLLRAENLPRFRPVLGDLLAEAEAHLAAGWRYTNELPSHWWRLRFACALPILIGVRTIELLRAGNVLAPAPPLKVSRGVVRSIIVRSALAVPFPGVFKALWHPPAGGVGKAVASSGDLT